MRVVAITGRQYTVEELTNPLADVPLYEPRSPSRSPLPEATPAADAGWLPVELTGYAKRIWEGVAVKYTIDGRVDRSASLVRIARVLHAARLSRTAIVAALAERDMALGWRKFSDRDDAQAQYERIVAYVERRR